MRNYMLNNKKQNQFENMKFSISKIQNDSFIATLIENGAAEININSTNGDETVTYDHQGALLYVCAVIIIFALSIFAMIGSLAKKNMSDHGVSLYMKEMGKMQRLERKHRTFRTRLFMQKLSSSLRSYEGRQEPNRQMLQEGESFLSLVHKDHHNTSILSFPSEYTEKRPAIPLTRQLIASRQDLSEDDSVFESDSNLENDYKIDIHGSASDSQNQLPEVLIDNSSSATCKNDTCDIDTGSSQVLSTRNGNGCVMEQITKPSLDAFGRKISSSSLHPVIETDEEVNDN